MRIKLKPVKNVIKIDKQFARLVDIDKYGRPVYRLNYFADVPNSIIKGAHIIRITAYTRDPLKKTSFFQGVRNSSQVTKNVQMRFARRKDQIRRARDRHVGKSYSDITSGISNKIALQILKNPELADQLVGKRKILRAVSATSVNRQEHKEPPNTALSTFNNADKIQGASLRQSAVKSIITLGVDPSFIGGLAFPLISSRDATQGIVGNKATRSDRIRRQKYGRRKKARVVNTNIAKIKSRRRKSRSLRAVNFHRPAKNLKTFFQRGRSRRSSGTSTVTTNTHIVQYSVPARWKGFNEIIRINRQSGKGAARLYFLFELLGKDNRIVYQLVREVNHEKQLDKYLTPRVPPSLEVTGAVLGINRLQFEQMDPMGTRIRLYRKYLNPKDASISRKYKLLTNLELGYGDGSINYTDNVNNTMACIYRAVAVGPRGTRSQRFRNAISRPLILPTKSGIRSDDFEHVSIFAESTNEGVRVRLSNIPEGPISAYVLKTDMTARCATRAHHGHCTLVGTDPEDQVQLITAETPELYFPDLNVTANRIYRYQCVMTYPSGKEIIGKVDVLHEHIVDFEQDNISFNIGQPTATLDDNGIAAVSFDTAIDLTDEGFNQVLALLEQANVSQDFQKEISGNRSKLGAMIGVLVERQDNISGETETFGVQETGTFVDNKLSRIQAGVSELSPGRNYRYTCKALLRDPGSLFSDTSQLTVDVETDGDFELKVAKFLNPYTLKHGTLPSTQRGLGTSELSGLVPRDPFLQGKSSVDRSVDVAIPSQRTQITNITAVSLGEYETSIMWEVLGALDEIDHFIVLAEHDGVKSPIGTVHNLSETGKFDFMDDDLGAEVGTTHYSLVPVFADYTYGGESQSVSVTESEEYPVFTIGT